MGCHRDRRIVQPLAACQAVDQTHPAQGSQDMAAVWQAGIRVIHDDMIMHVRLRNSGTMVACDLQLKQTSFLVLLQSSRCAECLA
jgi:hypothetical protein